MIRVEIPIRFISESPNPEASLYLMFRSPKIRLYLYQNHRRKIVNSTLFQVI